jgi:hypothetical protein
MREIEDIVRSELERFYPQPEREPDWESIRERARVESAAETARKAPRRWRLAVAFGLPVLVVALAVGLLLAGPWKSGPAAISAAEAATILKKTQAALAYPAGSVEHVRTQTTYTLIPLKQGAASLTERIGGEWWIETAPPFQHRSLQSYRSQTLETGGSRKCHAHYVYYDPTTGGLYRDNRFDAADCGGSPLPFDPATAIRELVAAGALKLSGKTQIAGRNVYRFELLQRYYDKRFGHYQTLSGTGTLYVDAHDYRLVRFEWDSQEPRSARFRPSPYGSYHAVVDYLAWDYLAPNAANLRLADIGKQHPAARMSTLDKMPTDATRKLVETMGACSAIPPIPAGGVCAPPSLIPVS